MNWTTAWLNMMLGHKVRRTCWRKGSYWKIAGGEVIMHTADGADLNFRNTTNMAKFLGVTCCDDWETVCEDVPEDAPD